MLSQLFKYFDLHPNAEIPFTILSALSNRAQWKSPAEIKEAFRNASFTGNNRVIFNVKGNDYRLVAMVRYDKGLIFIRFIGTQIEYDKIDVVKI
jgi:mRNA interferase HigB